MKQYTIQINPQDPTSVIQFREDERFKYGYYMFGFKINVFTPGGAQ